MVRPANSDSHPAGIERLRSRGGGGAGHRALEDGDVYARVTLWFPTSHGWWVRDRAAGVRHLAPLPPDFRERLADDWSAIGPVLEGAGKVADAAAPFSGPCGPGRR